MTKLKYKLMVAKVCVQENIFNQKDYYYAHCIKRDYALGVGIAVEFDKRYNTRDRLLKLAEEKSETLDKKYIEIQNVFNLITKEK